MHQNVGDLAINQSTRIPAVATLTRSGWVTLSDQAGSQPAIVADGTPLLRLDAGQAASAEDLAGAADGTVVTTSVGGVYQRQHSQWWRLTATWTGECSAIPEADIAAATPMLRWAAPNAVRA